MTDEDVRRFALLELKMEALVNHLNLYFEHVQCPVCCGVSSSKIIETEYCSQCLGTGRNMHVKQKPTVVTMKYECTWEEPGDGDD